MENLRKKWTHTRLLFVMTPFVRSKQLEWPLHWIVLPEIIHIWFVLPVAHVKICSSSISTAPPSVLEAAVRHFAELTVGWMYMAVGVGPDGAIEEKTGVPV
jgi:hypothetical protein